MWSVISRLLLRVAALRWLFKLGGLGLLLPIAFLLKMVGLPLLGVLSVLAVPVLILLFVFGLPIFLVLMVGGMLMGLLGLALTIGIAALKIGLFVVLPIWLVWMLVSRIFCRSRGCSSKPRDRGDDGTPSASSDPFMNDSPSTDPLTDL
jgi:hypothetical protein